MSQGDIIERIVRLKAMRDKYRRLAADAKKNERYSLSRNLMRAVDRCTKAIQREQRKL